METRILYASISAISAWMTAFLVKISAEKNYNSLLFTWYSLLSASFFAFLFYCFSWEGLDKILFLITIGSIMWISYAIALVSKTEALKNITTTLYFPIYKILSTLLAFIVWISFFTDAIKTNEIIWIFIWLLVPLVLINKKENKKQKNMKLWLLLSIVWIVFAVITITMSKIIKSHDLNIYFYIFVWTLIWWVMCLGQYKRNYKVNINSINKIKRTSIINGLIIMVWSTFFVKAMTWNLWVVYTINSFSILIPIVLSVIFYKDHLDLRKIIAIVLTIVSMLFFKVF